VTVRAWQLTYGGYRHVRNQRGELVAAAQRLRQEFRQMIALEKRAESPASQVGSLNPLILGDAIKVADRRIAAPSRRRGARVNDCGHAALQKAADVGVATTIQSTQACRIKGSSARRVGRRLRNVPRCAASTRPARDEIFDAVTAVFSRLLPRWPALRPRLAPRLTKGRST